MKKTLSILLFALFSASAFAGVARFSARHMVKPAVKATGTGVLAGTYPVRHPKRSARKTFRAAKTSAKATSKVVVGAAKVAY